MEEANDDLDNEQWIRLAFTWSGRPFEVDIAESDRCSTSFVCDSICFVTPRAYRVFDLKAALQSLTDVPPDRQKIIGLVKGKLPSDDDRMYDWLTHIERFPPNDTCFVIVQTYTSSRARSLLWWVLPRVTR